MRSDSAINGLHYDTFALTIKKVTDVRTIRLLDDDAFGWRDHQWTHSTNDQLQRFNAIMYSHCIYSTVKRFPLDTLWKRTVSVSAHTLVEYRSVYCWRIFAALCHCFMLFCSDCATEICSRLPQVIWEQNPRRLLCLQIHNHGAQSFNRIFQVALMYTSTYYRARQ